MMQKESKIKPEFSTLSKTINILGSELGNVIKQQAGKNKYELVEEIRINSKKIIHIIFLSFEYFRASI